MVQISFSQVQPIKFQHVVQLLNGKQSVLITCATETDGYTMLVALRTNGMNWNRNSNVFFTATVHVEIFYD